MNKSLFFRKAVFFSLAILLLITPASVKAQSSPSDPFIVSADSVQEVFPAVAYNNDAHEYLVVWFNDRPGCDDIRGQRISRSGRLLGSPFYISAECPANRQYPDVVYNSAHQQYLVVWESHEESAGYSIKGRRVSGAGQVLDQTDITIRDSGYNLYTPGKPAVGYASMADRYLVVWQETWHPMPITHGIYGQLVTADGVLEASEFDISEGPEVRAEADLAYNRSVNRYLVVWQQEDGPLTDVHGQQVYGGGSAYMGDITIAYYTVSSTEPAVAALPEAPASHRFMVVWRVEYSPSDPGDIYGCLVSEDGASLSYVDVDFGNDIDTHPAVAGIEKSLEYAVVYRHSVGGLNNPIRKQSITESGTVKTPLSDIWGVNAEHPAVTGGYSTDVFVVWQDQPLGSSTTNIYGYIFVNRLYLPITVR